MKIKRIYLIAIFACCIVLNSCVKNPYIEYGPEKLSRKIDREGGTIHFFESFGDLSEPAFVMEFPQGAVQDELIVEWYMPDFTFSDNSSLYYTAYSVNEKYIALAGHYFLPYNASFLKPVKCSFRYSTIYKSGNYEKNLFEDLDKEYLKNALKVYKILDFPIDKDAGDTLLWSEIPEENVDFDNEEALFNITDFNSAYFLAFQKVKYMNSLEYDYSISSFVPFYNEDFEGITEYSGYEPVKGFDSQYPSSLIYEKNGVNHGHAAELEVHFTGESEGIYVCDNVNNYAIIYRRLLVNSAYFDLFFTSTPETVIEITEYTDSVGGQIKGKVYGEFNTSMDCSLDVNYLNFSITRGIVTYDE